MQNTNTDSKGTLFYILIEEKKLLTCNNIVPYTSVYIDSNCNLIFRYHCMVYLSSSTYSYCSIPLVLRNTTLEYYFGMKISEDAKCPPFS